jgi:hypothetical protein
MGVTASVLRLLKHGSRVQLEALAKLCDRNQGFDDPALHLEAERKIQEILEKAYEAGEGVGKEKMLDGVLELGMAHRYVAMSMNRRGQGDEREACVERAKEGFCAC